MRTLAEDVDALGRALGTIIFEQEGAEFFALEERIRLATKQLRFGRHSLTRESDLASSPCRFSYSV